MTDNQFSQLFDLVTKGVMGVQEVQRDITELKQDVSELKQDVSELKQGQMRLEEAIVEVKDGQNRIEKQIRLNNAAVNQLAGEQLRINSRIVELEKASV